MNRLRTARAGLGAFCLVALILVGAPASALAAPGDTLLVSRADGPGPADANNIILDAPDISANGRYVAFSTRATNLDPADPDSLDDVYVRDVERNETTLVSRASGPLGAKGTSASREPSISPDGRFVAFRTASALVPDDTNGVDDVYVRNLEFSTTARVSLATDGAQADGASFRPSISRDGRRVAFESDATNLLGPGNDTNGERDVFVRDVQENTTRVVSRPSGTGGPEANDSSNQGRISADGRVVAFASEATNLAPGDIERQQIFARDLEANTTRRVSVARGGGQPEAPGGGGGSAGASAPSISGNGRFVAFGSNADNLVEEDTNDRDDIFVRDLRQGTTTRANVGNDGRQSNGNSGSPSLSFDGSRVAFSSGATNLLEPDGQDTTSFADIFVRDLDTGTTTLATRPHQDNQGQADRGPFARSAISGDGRFVAFYTTATNLIGAGNDTNNRPDVFRRELVAPSADLALTGAGSPRSVTVGQNITYTFTATNRGGPNVGRSVTLTDPLPAGVTYRSSSASQGSCTPSADRRTVTCDLGELARDASARVTIVVTANRAGTVVNTASVAGSPEDPNPANNSASVATAVTRPQCADGRDNDRDGRVDARDPGCTSRGDNSEADRCTITRGSGDDVIRGTPGNDVICAGAGDDVVYGRGGNDTVFGGGGRDVVHVRGGNDTVYGQGGKDVVHARGGNDTVFGGGGRDIVYGGGGNDTVFGQGGKDVLDGQAGDDRLVGGSGEDVLLGHGGRDALDARDGVRDNDVAHGGRNADSCAADPRDVRTSC